MAAGRSCKSSQIKRHRSECCGLACKAFLSCLHAAGSAGRTTAVWQQWCTSMIKLSWTLRGQGEAVGQQWEKLYRDAQESVTVGDDEEGILIIIEKACELPRMLHFLALYRYFDGGMDFGEETRGVPKGASLKWVLRAFDAFPDWPAAVVGDLITPHVASKS